MNKQKTLPEDFRYLPGRLDATAQQDLATAIARVIEAAPLYRPVMPRTGRAFSVRMTNCGRLGWLSDKAGGYRYEARHPVTGQPWPAIPDILLTLWADLSHYPAPPEACLVNHYAPGAKLGLHRDQDEADMAAPVISVSLGDDAWFRIGGLGRRDPTVRLLLRSGDVVVLAGKSRLAYHALDRIVAGSASLFGEPGRINLTLRRVNRA